MATPQEWLSVDPNPSTRADMEQLLNNNDLDAIDRLMSPRIAFGTAGLRSAMAPGYANMNDVTIIQASQGLVDYIKEGPIVVGYDHRFHSQRFAEITAAVALSRGFDVYYLSTSSEISEETKAIDAGVTPKHPYGSGGVSDAHVGGKFSHTPMVPFTIDEVGASAGVMVTASHNPAVDNGYKVYYGNGCQIIPPVDTGIAASINANLKSWTNYNISEIFAKGLSDGKLKVCLAEMQSKYLAKVQKLVTDPELGFGFTYTPLHGVGFDIVLKALPAIFSDFNLEVVTEQQQPDPRFPTVAFPNPEEKGALDMAIELAKANGHKLVVANDPDADRFSAAIETSSGWRQLTGNELGFLFARYVVDNYNNDLSKLYLVNSTVSSQILKSMAEVEGCNYCDTLTGFKWIGNKAIDLTKQGYNVPFAYEEAIGFMFNTVNDKDGVAAMTVFLQLYKYYKQDLLKALEEGYSKYGYYKECNGYYRVPVLSVTNDIFVNVRQSRKPLDDIGDFSCLTYRDLTTGYQSDTSNHVPDLPVDPNSQMITALVQDKATGAKARFTARGSGTEPKIKIYCEGFAPTEAEASEIARKCWDSLKHQWFRPAEYGLKEVVN